MVFVQGALGANGGAQQVIRFEPSPGMVQQVDPMPADGSEDWIDRVLADVRDVFAGTGEYPEKSPFFLAEWQIARMRLGIQVVRDVYKDERDREQTRFLDGEPLGWDEIARRVGETKQRSRNFLAVAFRRVYPREALIAQAETIGGNPRGASTTETALASAAYGLYAAIGEPMGPGMERAIDWFTRASLDELIIVPLSKRGE